MTTAVAPRTRTETLTLDRKSLLTALDRVRQLVPARCPKPILTGIRLEAALGELSIAATDGEIKLSTRLEADGALPPCVVSCDELSRRVRTSKAGTCTLTFQSRRQKLLINGGYVEHALHTLPLDDFPPVATEPEGESITLPAAELSAALACVSPAVAREPSHYAIDGVLLESDDAGARLVATDGRRMAIAELQVVRRRFRGCVILPGRLCALVGKLVGKNGDGPLCVSVRPNTNENDEKQPVDVWLAAAGWTLACVEADGHFPLYRDVVPRSGSKFVVDHRQLTEALPEVALATRLDAPTVRVDLSPRRIRLAAESPESGRSSAKLPVRFVGGGDAEIHTGFNARYLLDALKALTVDRLVLDIQQNGCGADGKVFGRPLMLHGEGDQRVRWIVMSVNLDLPPTRANLGSNYRENA